MVILVTKSSQVGKKRTVLYRTVLYRTVLYRTVLHHMTHCPATGKVSTSTNGLVLHQLYELNNFYPGI